VRIDGKIGALLVALGFAFAWGGVACSDSSNGGGGGSGGFGAAGGSGGSGNSGGSGGSGGSGETGGSGGGVGGSGGTAENGGSGGGGTGGSGGGSPTVCDDGGPNLAITLSGSGFDKYDGKHLHGAVAEAGSDRNVGKEQSVLIENGRFSITWPALADPDKAYHLVWYVGKDNDDDRCDDHDESWIFENYEPTKTDCTHHEVYAPATAQACNFF
jgi:hypothetical protein